MKYTITIEEIISQTFDIEAVSKEDALKKAKEMYRDNELIVENGNLLDVKFN